jgi:hypothetical protein
MTKAVDVELAQTMRQLQTGEALDTVQAGRSVVSG